MKKYSIFLGMALWASQVIGQVGIGTSSPSRVSMLEVSSTADFGTTYRGLMPPRVPDISARDAINAGFADYGLLVFVTDNGYDEGCLQIWDGDSWENIACVQLASPVAWINEFHYNNAGIDVGEFIEIAGPAGLDLSNYTIELYSGNTLKTYGSAVPLSGTIPDQSSGLGTVNFSVSSINNVHPSGIALINNGSVLQFISYGGTFTPINGSANGMTSVDIGVKETDSTPVGHSLQLIGNGNKYRDFTWNPPSPESPGSINTGQNFN